MILDSGHQCLQEGYVMSSGHQCLREGHALLSGRQRNGSSHWSIPALIPIYVLDTAAQLRSPELLFMILPQN